MLKKIFSSKSGETYLEVAIGVLCVVMFLVIALNIFSAVTMYIHMDRIANDLLDVATYTGEFGDAFDAKIAELEERYFDFEVSIYSDKYYNTALKRVQLGDLMVVTVKANLVINGFGEGIEIPIEPKVQRSGKSENYWK